MHSRCIVIGLFLVVGLAGPAHSQSVRYVDDDAAVDNNGQSWATPYKYLQDALFEARNNSTITEIHVAGGVYHPDRAEGGHVTPGQRATSFELINGLGVYGGYAGLADPGEPDTRDLALYESILSGDIGTPGNSGDNSYHVVDSSGTDVTAVLDGFTISRGNANGPYPHHYGAGIYNSGGSPTLTNCTVSANTTRRSVYGEWDDAASYGAGMYNYGGSPTLTNCAFRGNSVSASASGDMTFAYAQGGGLYSRNGRPTLVDCIFSGNVASASNLGPAESYGGGIYAGNGATLINCVLSGNRATATTEWAIALTSGGGIYSSGSVALTNCTFSRNSVEGGDMIGGGIFTDRDSSATLTGCILWDNAPQEIYYVPSAPPVITYSCVRGGYSGTGNITTDPLFVDAAGPDGSPGTADDDVHLSPGSPCIDAGDSDAPGLVGITTDLDGWPRFMDDPDTPETGNPGPPGSGPIVDMGAYEFWHDCNDNGVPDALDIAGDTSEDCNYNGVPDSCDIAAGTSNDVDHDGIPDDCETDCNDNEVPDHWDISQGTSRDIDRDGIPDECEPDCNNNGLPDDLDIAQHTSHDVNGNAVPDECDPDCNGNGLPDDMDITQGTSDDVNGNAIPDECELDCNENGIPDDWDISNGPSGDCNTNGVPDECETVMYVDGGATEDPHNGSSWANAYIELSEALVAAECLTFPLEIRVAKGVYKPDPAGLSESREATFQLATGVRILGGYAGLGEPDPDQRSVELYETILSGDLLGNDGPGPFENYDDNCWTVVTAIRGAGPTAVLDGFTITGGEANTGGYEHMHGAGLFIAQDGAPNVINCTFMANRAEWGGGVACYDSSRPTFRNCTFTGNKTQQEGGGMWVAETSRPTLTDCTFSDNSADNTGGGLFSRGDATLAQCAFFRNTARAGGGIRFDEGQSTLVNCTFVGNTAEFGGGLYIAGGSSTLVNCTLSGNAAANRGGAIYQSDDYYDASSTLTNCIVWGNGDEVQVSHEEEDRKVIMTHTCIRGCWLGEGNLCYEPRFVRDPDPGPDQTWGTADDDLGDLHLTRSSPCIDAGDNLAVGVMGVTTDFEGDFRWVDGDMDGRSFVDMGADEYWADCNANGTHDGTDILNGTSYDWNENSIPDECDDCNNNGFPDVIDIVFGDSEDCNENWIPDECDIASGTSEDQGGDGVPDECLDCNYNGFPDSVDILVGRSQDCNNNDRPDECDIADETALDWNRNGIPDECEEDCNDNGLPDFADILLGTSEDVNRNGIPDECDVLGDLDADADCDIDDYAIFAGCLAGPNTAYPTDCDAADLDVDGDADLDDFALFQRAFMGP